MEIIRHLSHDELADRVLARDEQYLRETLETLPACAKTASEQPDEFWDEQRAKVSSRIAEAETRPLQGVPGLAWGAMAAMITVAVLMLHRSPPPQRQETQPDPDHELLIEVERAVQSHGPEALEPAALLAQEMVQARPDADTPIPKKEPTHEN